MGSCLCPSASPVVKQKSLLPEFLITQHPQLPRSPGRDTQTWQLCWSEVSLRVSVAPHSPQLRQPRLWRGASAGEGGPQGPQRQRPACSPQQRQATPGVPGPTVTLVSKGQSTCQGVMTKVSGKLCCVLGFEGDLNFASFP